MQGEAELAQASPRREVPRRVLPYRIVRDGGGIEGLEAPERQIGRRHDSGFDEALHAMGARPWAEVHPVLLPMLRDAAAVLAWRADFDARVLAQTAALHHRALPPVSWADVRPAYVKARPGGRHSLAGAMCREGLAWGGHHRAEADCRAVLALMRVIANA